MARRDEVAEGQVGNTRKVRLPASWPGSTRYNKRLVEDAMALVARYGKPAFFITFTANANWPEIQALLNAQGCNHQSALERPDAIIRVFRGFLADFMDGLRKRTFFGQQPVFLTRVIEFQKRGLIHSHIAVRIEGDQPLTGDAIDEFISAEMPRLDLCTTGRGPACDCDIHKLHKYVSRNMTHSHKEGKCYAKGQVPPSGDQRCKLGYPMPLSDVTMLDERGYPLYRRRTEQDRKVVPYNPHILLKAKGAHINTGIDADISLLEHTAPHTSQRPAPVQEELEENLGENFNIADFVEAEQVLQPLGEPAHREAVNNPLMNIDVEPIPPQYSHGCSSC
jgi:hypothetical protein